MGSIELRPFQLILQADEIYALIYSHSIIQETRTVFFRGFTAEDVRLPTFISINNKKNPQDIQISLFLCILLNVKREICNLGGFIKKS